MFAPPVIAKSRAKSHATACGGAAPQGPATLIPRMSPKDTTAARPLHWDFSTVSLGNPAGILQAKLTMSAPDDPLEREADRVADRVTGMDVAPAVTPARPAISRKCDACERDDEADQRLHRKSEGACAVCGRAIPASVHEVLQSRGQPLDKSSREYFEPRFGHSFGNVRVHVDPSAQASARDVNARAYTVGHQVVFGSGQFAPNTPRGRHLLAHELTHVVQQRSGRGSSKPSLARQAADDSQASVPTPDPVAPAPPQVTPGGHAAAPTGMAACPDAPSRSLIVLGCITPPAAAPPAVEKAWLPTLNPARFGGDADRAKFAQDLAQCHAARVVNDEVSKRYNTAVAAAKTKATEESKQDTADALKTAVAGVDPKDTVALGKAKKQAAADAKKAAAKKIADAQAAVTREDIAAVTAELAEDFDATLQGALKRFGPGWLNSMQAALNAKRKKITKEKSAKPKLAKGETAPPGKSAEQIAGEIETDMVDVRCDQTEWGLQQIESIAHAWAVGRREQVDFQTIVQSAAFLKNFAPTYAPAEQDLVDIPANVQEEKGMAGVAPETSDFLAQLAADPGTPSFKASNYHGHGGGTWAGQGFSVDLFVAAPTDQRGFWQHSTAVTFLLRLDATTKAMGARWRVLYNDFRVAQEVNAATGTRNVEFMGQSSASQLNWHGPAPLILHFHLDLEIPKKAAPTRAAPSQP